jgi:hypothetical protein
MTFLTSRGVAEGLRGTLLLLREELVPCLAVVGGSSLTALLRAKLRHIREGIGRDCKRREWRGGEDEIVII